MGIPISEARKNLFALFERVVRAEGEKFVITRRGHMQRAVLVSEQYLLQLEARLLPQKPRQRPPDPSPRFHMAGSARILGDPETVIAEVRALQRKLRREKERRWNKELRRDAIRRR